MSVRTPRTQEERSAATQRALLDATIDCLVEFGYAGTTTRLVADRAEVSRGAQTHHYPTKRDLVVAAVEHLFDTHARQFAAAFQEVPPHERTFDRAVEELWRIVAGPPFAAVLEVVVAARSDHELRVIVHGMAASLRHTVMDLLLWFSSEVDDPLVAGRIVDLAFTLVQGAAVSRMEGFGDPDEVIRLAAALADYVTTLVTPGATETETETREPSGGTR